MGERRRPKINAKIGQQSTTAGQRQPKAKRMQQYKSMTSSEAANPPESHSSDVSEEEEGCDDHGISESNTALEVECINAVMKQIDREDGGTAVGEEHDPSTPPSRSNLAVAAAEEAHTSPVVVLDAATLPSSTMEEGKTHIPPSSLPLTAVVKEEQMKMEKATDVDIEGLDGTNSYVDMHPGVIDISKKERTRSAIDEDENNIDDHVPSKQQLPQHPLIINHEHSNSLVHLPSLNNIDTEMAPEMETEEAAMEEEEHQAKEFSEAAGEEGEDPPASHEHSESYHAEDQDGVNLSSPTKDDETPQISAEGLSPTPAPPELAEALSDASTPPPNEDEGQEDVGESNTPTTATISSEDSSSLPLQHQRQPTGTHISEGLTKEDEDDALSRDTATRTPSPPPLSLDDHNDHQAMVISSPQSEAQAVSATSPHPPTNNKVQVVQLQNQKQLSPPNNQSSSSSITPSRITYASPKPPSPTIPGRRSITLRLLEEIPAPAPPATPTVTSPLLAASTPFRSLRRFRSLSLSSKSLTSHVNDAINGETSRTASNNGMATLDEKKPSPSGGGGGNESSTTVDRGTIVVSWYDGTTSSEMQDHVFNCVLRKLNTDTSNKGGKIIKLEDVRLLDENVTPHGEVVLCPFLPDGSHFLLRFKTATDKPTIMPSPPTKIYNRNPYAGPSFVSRAPDSPSAEPSPFPSTADLHSLGMQQRQQQQHQHLQNQQAQLLTAVAALLQQQQQHGGRQPPTLNLGAAAAAASSQLNNNGVGVPRIPPISQMDSKPREFPSSSSTLKDEKKEDMTITPIKEHTGMGDNATNSGVIKKSESRGEMSEPMSETDQLIEKQLRQLNELFLQRRSSSAVVPTTGEGVGNASESTSDVTKNNTDHEFHSDDQARAYHREEKRQVIFVIANYLVLFMSLIALSAEIQSRLPQWMDWVQQNYDSVQNCATDRDALIECLSNGDFSGLIASFLLWGTQSAAAKRIFLFGFDTPKKLWTVVYEALVTAVCWGTSYLFIRRGLNPNTRQNFLHKYWKDAVYGSLAGFNAAFMKAVLKNLVPQDVALEALEGRQLKIFHWLGTMLSEE